MEDIQQQIQQETTEVMTNLVDSVKTFWNDLPLVLTRLIEALLILAAGLMLIKFGRRAIKKLCEAHAKKIGQEPSAQTRTLQALILSAFNTVMYFVTILAILSSFGVNIESLLALAGIGGVAIGFGCQTLVKDIVSGLFLWFEGRLNVGDVVTVGGQTGAVENIALRTTTLRAASGVLYTIPNGDIRTVVNMTRDFRNATVDLTVAHGQDYTAVIGKLEEALTDFPDKCPSVKEVPRVVGYIAANRDAATLRIECRCDTQDCWEVERAIRLAALECFRREQIKT